MAYIAIVDDDVEQVGNMERVLKTSGHEVHAAYDTKSGLEMIQNRVPDIIILDVMFPGNMSGGFDMARKLRSIPRLDTVPVIMLTSINRQFSFQFSNKDIDPDWMPVTEYLDKPVDFELLKNKVAALLQR